MRITLDASVLVAAGAPDDPASSDAAASIQAALAGGATLHQPSLTMVEVAAAIARRTGDASLAMEATAVLVSMPGLVVHALDGDTAADASALAARLRLRGADAVYVATALHHDSTLITLDKEQLERASDLIAAMTPQGWLTSGGRA